jgi:hypothetical protein
MGVPPLAVRLAWPAGSVSGGLVAVAATLCSTVVGGLDGVAVLGGSAGAACPGMIATPA